MPVNLSFYAVREKQPKHGQEIWLIRRSSFYNDYGFALEKIEYQWDEIDESDGGSTGCSFIYEEGKPQPTGTRLVVIAGNYGLEDGDLWADPPEIEDALFPREEKASLAEIEGKE